MIENAEFGYTPDNLRRLLKKHDITQKEAREHIGKGRNTFGRYMNDVGDPNHVSMAYADWLKILKFVQDRI